MNNIGLYKWWLCDVGIPCPCETKFSAPTCDTYRGECHLVSSVIHCPKHSQVIMLVKVGMVYINNVDLFKLWLNNLWPVLVFDETKK